MKVTVPLPGAGKQVAQTCRGKWELLLLLLLDFK